MTKDDNTDSKIVIDKSGKINKLKLYAYCKDMIRIFNFKYSNEAITACFNEYKNNGKYNWI